MKKLFVIAFFAMFIFATTAFSQFADSDVTKRSLALGITGQNENAVSSLTLVFPYEKIKGYGGIYAARQTGNGILVDENIVGRLQGGGDIGVFKLRGYTEATRNLYQAVDLGIEVGYFVESPNFFYKEIEFSAGAGNFSERRDLDNKIGRDAGDNEVSFGWLGFLTAERGCVSTVLRLKPDIAFDEFAAEFEVSISKDLKENLAMQLVNSVEYDTDSVIDTDWTRTYMFQLVYTQ